MKPVGRFTTFLAGGVALAAVLSVWSAQAAVGRASSRSVSGTASLAQAGGEWMPLKSGQTLEPGATVRTGVDGAVDLYLAENGPDVHLFDSTTLALDRLNVERTGTDTVVETSLNLTSGTIRGYVRKLAAASKYEVKTPNAVFGVRPGTETRYQISANGKGSVIEGALVVVYINPSTQQMSTHNVGTGETFEPPINPGAPGATPRVRETRPDEIIPMPEAPTAPKLVVVPAPEPFVEPIRRRESEVTPVEPRPTTPDGE